MLEFRDNVGKVLVEGVKDVEREPAEPENAGHGDEETIGAALLGEESLRSIPLSLTEMGKFCKDVLLFTSRFYMSLNILDRE